MPEALDSQFLPGHLGLGHTRTSARETGCKVLAHRIMNLQVQITCRQLSRTLTSPNPFAAHSWKFKVGVDFRDFKVHILHRTCAATGGPGGLS